jgi:pimeloyl-ACP methyl ester carboxylesterase
MADNSLRVAVPGGALEVTASGSTDSTALVFLHYWGGSARTWTLVIDRLAPSLGWARFDQRGWGSARHVPGPYGLDQLAADGLAVVAALGLRRYILVGHSMGGKIAQLAGSTHPSGLVGLALVAPAPARPVKLSADEIKQRAAAYDSATAVETALDTVLTAEPLTGAMRLQALALEAPSDVAAALGDFVLSLD